MKRISVADGVYRDGDGGYWARPTIHGRRTWRRLKAIKPKEAIKEALATDFTGRCLTLADLAQRYVDDSCPNSALEKRPHLVVREQKYLRHILPYFGSMASDEIRLYHLPLYRDWRVKRLTKDVTGNRIVEHEWCTLSNVLNYGVSTGRLEINFIRSGRPRLRRPADIVHCRDRAPKDVEELHDLAARLMQHPQSSSLGWQMLFEAFTGSRTNEVIRMRTDAAPREPGCIEGNLLWLHRSKRGVNPFAEIHDHLAQLIQAHRQWLGDRSVWYFPGRDPSQPVSLTSLTSALLRMTGNRVNSHGLRSFYVTTRRSQNVSDAQIAAEIGDQTVALISTTYGDRPPSWWNGNKPMSWLPAGLPAWARSPICSPVLNTQGNRPIQVVCG